jgi:transcription elongation factor Elf1
MTRRETLACSRCGRTLVSFDAKDMTVRQDVRITIKDHVRNQGVVHCPSCGTEIPVNLAKFKNF